MQDEEGDCQNSLFSPVNDNIMTKGLWSIITITLNVNKTIIKDKNRKQIRMQMSITGKQLSAQAIGDLLFLLFFC